MAKVKTQTASSFKPKSKVSRPNVHATTKTSKLKSSKLSSVKSPRKRPRSGKSSRKRSTESPISPTLEKLSTLRTLTSSLSLRNQSGLRAGFGSDFSDFPPRLTKMPAVKREERVKAPRLKT